jgi:hypothetical protein
MFECWSDSFSNIIIVSIHITHVISCYSVVNQIDDAFNRVACLLKSFNIDISIAHFLTAYFPFQYSPYVIPPCLTYDVDGFIENFQSISIY